jgi:UDP-N-acetylmuramate--alanine ligase
VVAARAAGVPVLRRADVLAAMTRLRRTIAVAGTHGKTTTSAMLATILDEAGRHPSFVVGGQLLGLGTGARWDDGEWFVVEADESDGTFLDLAAEVAVVTSVEPDHLEHWGGFGELVAGFGRFVGAARTSVVCADDAGAAKLDAATTYGFAEAARFRLASYEGERGGCRFTIEDTENTAGGGAVPVEVRLNVCGRYNARNAAAALAAATEAGVSLRDGAAALAAYRGVARRAQTRGERDGVTYVDDYAHLPTEVASATNAAQEGGWRRVVVVFQPHRYSRTASLWRDFAGAFGGADVLAVTDIYAADEPARPGISGKLIVDAVLGADPDQRVAWLPTRAGLLTFLRRELRAGDLCLTLGAGDLTTLPDEMLGAGS